MEKWVIIFQLITKHSIGRRLTIFLIIYCEIYTHTLSNAVIEHHPTYLAEMLCKLNALHRLPIALIRDDVTKISRNVKPRLGGDRFAWFVDVLGKIFRCSCFSLFVRNASMVYCLRLYKLFRHGNQKVLASLTAGEQRTAFQMACKNSTNEHAS